MTPWFSDTKFMENVCPGLSYVSLYNHGTGKDQSLYHEIGIDLGIRRW